MVSESRPFDFAQGRLWGTPVFVVDLIPEDG